MPSTSAAEVVRGRAECFEFSYSPRYDNQPLALVLSGFALA